LRKLNPHQAVSQYADKKDEGFFKPCKQGPYIGKETYFVKKISFTFIEGKFAKDGRIYLYCGEIWIIMRKCFAGWYFNKRS